MFMKLDFFRPQWKSWHVRLVLLGLVVGLPLEVLAAWGLSDLDFSAPDYSMLLYNGIHELGSMALCLGYLGAICLVVREGRNFLAKGIGAAGKMALSVYIGETILATFVVIRAT